jgi:hypothetical protein
VTWLLLIESGLVFLAAPPVAMLSTLLCGALLRRRHDRLIWAGLAGLFLSGLSIAAICAIPGIAAGEMRDLADTKYMGVPFFVGSGLGLIGAFFGVTILARRTARTPGKGE